MAILSVDHYVAAPKQRIQYTKTGVRTTVANMPFSLFELAGQPGAGVLAVGNTANGVVPIQGQAGYPAITPFAPGAIGYLSLAQLGSSVAGRAHLYDRVFKAGAYAFNADTTLTAQPSFSHRVPAVNGFRDLEIWVEQVTAATGNQAVEVRYTNQDGVTGRSTGAVGIAAAPTVGRCWHLPLQPGDSGVQRIDRVIGTVATVGTFNVMVLRPLWMGTIAVAGLGITNDMLSTGLPIVFADSALFPLVSPTGTSSGVPMATWEIVNG